MTTPTVFSPDEIAKEEWRPIAGYEGLYEVSSLGRVRSLDRLVHGYGYAMQPKNGRMLKLDGSRPYLAVTLCRRQVLKRMRVNRLVAQAFLPPPLPGQSEVGHIDHQPRNNRHTNLEWCTHLENVAHSTVAMRKARKLTADAVRSVWQSHHAGESSSSIARRLGVSSQNISDIVTGKLWAHVT